MKFGDKANKLNLGAETLHVSAESSLSTSETVPTLPEWLERLTLERRTLIETANTLLIDEPLTEVDADCGDAELGELIQQRFQTALRNFYITSGLADKVAAVKLSTEISPTSTPLDEQILHLIATEGQGTHGWLDMLPALRKTQPEIGFNCTLASAMLHEALQAVGYENLHIAKSSNHQLTIRREADGSCKLYDPTSYSHVGNAVQGHVRSYTASDVKQGNYISENSGRVGYLLELPNDNESVSSHGTLYYVYDSTVLTDLQVALSNLAEVKKYHVDEDEERRQQAPELLLAYPELSRLDAATIKKRFNYLTQMKF